MWKATVSDQPCTVRVKDGFLSIYSTKSTSHGRILSFDTLGTQVAFTCGVQDATVNFQTPDIVASVETAIDEEHASYEALVKQSVIYMKKGWKAKTDVEGRMALTLIQLSYRGDAVNMT